MFTSERGRQRNGERMTTCYLVVEPPQHRSVKFILRRSRALQGQADIKEMHEAGVPGNSARRPHLTTLCEQSSDGSRD